MSTVEIYLVIIIVQLSWLTILLALKREGVDMAKAKIVNWYWNEGDSCVRINWTWGDEYRERSLRVHRDWHKYTQTEAGKELFESCLIALLTLEAKGVDHE